VETLFGNLDRALPGTLRSLIDGVNRELAEFVLQSGDVLLDVAGLAETVGLADWHNPQLWNMAKFAFSDELIPLYADHVARTVAAIRGKSRKVLILDLDNTVWGGVIGDDGLEGIMIAQGDARGEAHLAVQRMALDLRQRGILLAVSSKNTDPVAREPFEKHAEMLLKLDHIAVFQANWSDKATNIQAIAEELSLGLDADWCGSCFRKWPSRSCRRSPHTTRARSRRRGISRQSRLPPKISSAQASIRTTRGAPACRSRWAAWTRTWHRWI
jgi:HAD superfamily phosphatase (TIGR01681 family)